MQAAAFLALHVEFKGIQTYAYEVNGFARCLAT